MNRILPKIIFGLIAICLPEKFAIADESIAIRTGLSQIDDIDLKRHVTTLAADGFEGREAGSRGGKASAAYLRTVLKRIRESNPLPREITQEFGADYQNLLVMIPGSDPQLKNELIIVGAHYDHVGYGKLSNSQGPIGQIHNGADDNASGTAALLELVEAFSALEVAPRCSILFAFWDAEEVGLLGSKHWVANPTFPLQNVRFALNIDMIGRLRDQKLLTVGWRSAPGLRTLLASHNVTNQLHLAYQPRVNADSDHYPFYSAKIPTIHLDTDKHNDYHRPTDDPEKLNWEGMKSITEFAFRMIFDAANRSEFPLFRRDALVEGVPTWLTPQRPIHSVSRLGVYWNPEQAKNNVAVVSRIIANSAAATAGIRPGDKVIQLGQWRNGSFDDLKTTVQVVKNPVMIRVERQGELSPIELKAELNGTPIRLGAGWVDDSALPNCVVLTHVISESPADRAGLLSGDVILELSGRTITSSDELRERVLLEQGPFKLRVERNGRIRDVTIDPLDESTDVGKVTSPNQLQR